MNNAEIVKKLEEIDKTVRYLVSQLKKNEEPKEMSPIQKAVRIATCSKSTEEEVKEALQTLIETPQTLSIKQAAFVLYFSMLNRQSLGEDINYFFDIELGKHNYRDRESFIQGVGRVIENDYKGSADFKVKVANYLETKKRK